MHESGDALICDVGILTRDRPALLDRCLQSFAKGASESGLRLRFLICDDARAHRGMQSNATVVVELARRFPDQRFVYANKQHRFDLACKLKQQGISAGALRGLFGRADDLTSSPGANRNMLLLGTVGQRFLSIDDDAVCDLHPIERHQRQLGWEVSDGLNGAISFVRPEATQFSSASSPRLKQFLDAHASLLGQQSRLSAAESSQDHIVPEGLVRITLTGILGDSGIPDLRKFLFSQGRLRRRFLNCNARKGTPATRLILRGVPIAVISSRGSLITTTATGMDHVSPLPPFASGLRGEDSLFGLTASCLSRPFVFGHVPYAMRHSPIEARQYGPLPIGPGKAEMLAQIIACAPLKSANFLDRCRELGDYISEHPIAGSARERRQWSIEHQLGFIDIMLQSSAQLRRRYRDQPYEWSSMLIDWEHTLESESERLQKLRRALPQATHDSFAKDFAVLLKEWPSILTTMHTIREDAGVLFKCVSAASQVSHLLH